MAATASALLAKLQDRFGSSLLSTQLAQGQITLEISPAEAMTLFTALRDESDFGFSQLMDLCGVDYAGYGDTEWQTQASTNLGFSRGVTEKAIGRGKSAMDQVSHRPNAHQRRFAVVYQLLSISHNHRLRIRVFAPDDELPRVNSVHHIWSSADWYEREAFDLFGIVFEGHPDLRRLLTDYGFVGYPFRKDFPLTGHVEMRYDTERGRVIYQPVTIEPRVLVPRVIRQDHRYTIIQEKNTDA